MTQINDEWQTRDSGWEKHEYLMRLLDRSAPRASLAKWVLPASQAIAPAKRLSLAW